MTDDEALPELETGWLPTTPATDTYLRRYLLNWAGLCAATAQSFGGDALDLPAMRLADARRYAPFNNSVTLMQPLTRATVNETMATVETFFGFGDPARRGDVLLFSAWPTGDLRPFGWTLMGYPPLHLLPDGIAARPAPAALRIDEVRDRDGLLAWERVARDGFPIELPAGAPPGALVDASWLGDPRRRMWVGWVDERPVAASAAWIEHGINDVTVVATLPEARRHGYGEALTWRAAQADPALPAMLFSSDDGRRVYDRMGFLPLQRLTLWYRGRG